MQLPIESSDLLVITTNKGLFRYKRLPFGLASSPEIFQRYLNQMLNNIEGVCVYRDDILVCGSTPEEHANCLKLVLKSYQTIILKSIRKNVK